MCDCLANIPNEQLFFEDRKGFTSCVICMEFIQETNQTTLKCGHQYHASCYSENILSGNNHCALCRDEVCREIEQIPHISKTMVAVFMEQMLLQNKGQRITELFKELGYQEDLLHISHYECVIRIMLDFGFNLGYTIRNWVKEGNQRYFNDDENYTMIDTIHFIPENNEDDSAQPPETNTDTEAGGSPMSMDDLPPYEELYNHLIENDRVQMLEFIEKYDLQNFQTRLLGNEHLSNLDNLLSSEIEDIMWPSAGPGHRPLFTTQEAEQIFGGILRYNAEVYRTQI